MKKINLVIPLSILIILTSCGGSSGGGSGSSASNTWAALHPDSFAVASPLSSSGTSLSVIRESQTLNGDEPLSEKAEFFESIASGTNGCSITLPNLNGFGSSANCYGPSVSYIGHPNGVGGNGSLPTGDLGLWDATEGATTEACAAAQINKLMETTSKYIDAALMLEASSLCLLDENSIARPSVGSSADFTASFEQVIQETNPNATITTATVSRTSTDVYLFIFKGTTDGAKEFEVNVKLKNISSTSYEGRIYGFFTTMNKDAFSVGFSRDDSDLAIRMLAGSWTGATATSNIINASGDLILDDSWSGNMNQAILNMNVATQEGQISYGWQAGSGDDKIRVFNAYSKLDGNDLGGCGYFGFGDDFDSDYANNTNAINGFICNWAGPGNDHSMSSTANKAQKQCFSLNTTNGIFEEVLAKRAITYAPTVSCNDTDGGFTYDWPAHSGDAATNNLINITSDTDYSNYTAPTAPTLSI